jgi:hypothetical protein
VKPAGKAREQGRRDISTIRAVHHALVIQ